MGDTVSIVTVLLCSWKAAIDNKYKHTNVRLYRLYRANESTWNKGNEISHRSFFPLRCFLILATRQELDNLDFTWAKLFLGSRDRIEFFSSLGAIQV